MDLGCVRVDLTVRLGRGVEGFDGTDACIFGVALQVSICPGARSRGRGAHGKRAVVR